VFAVSDKVAHVVPVAAYLLLAAAAIRTKSVALAVSVLLMFTFGDGAALWLKHVLERAAASGQLPPHIASMCQRPCPPLSGCGADGTNNGMPSAHAQTMGFLAGVFMLPMWRAAKHNEIPMQHAALASVVLLSLAAWVAASRVSSGCHTHTQVAVGGSLGVAFGATCSLILSHHTGQLQWWTSTHNNKK
jgi:membrane-associated phospholipid phosphatase